MRLTRQELNPISFFQRIVIPASTVTVPAFLNINKDSVNLSLLQIKFNYTVYTNCLSSYGAVCLHLFGRIILLYLNLCGCVCVWGGSWLQDGLSEAEYTLCRWLEIRERHCFQFFEPTSDRQENGTAVTSFAFSSPLFCSFNHLPPSCPSISPSTCPFLFLCSFHLFFSLLHYNFPCLLVRSV